MIADADVGAQQAVIEEARRRARRRRRWAACALFAALAATGALIGFVRDDAAGNASGGVRPNGTAAGAPDVRSGTIALFADGYLKLVTPDGSDVGKLTGGLDGKPCRYPCSIVDYAWAPDGAQLGFVRSEGGLSMSCGRNCRAPRSSLFVIGADGTGERHLISCGGPCGGDFQTGKGFSWSPDSSRILLAMKRGLVIVDVRTGEQRSIDRGGASPSWSPDGQTIAYASGERIMTIDGGELEAPKAITPRMGFWIDTISWSPDSRTIAFDGGDAVHTVRASGAQLTRVLDGEVGSGPATPSWSPDGTRLLYFNTPGTPGAFTAEIWTMKPSGADKTLVRRLECCVGSWSMPIWSPDGTQIAFAADGQGAISGTYVMSTDGSDLRLLHPGPIAVTWRSLR